MLHISSKNSLSQLTNVQEIDIQPNAVDLRLARVFEINKSMFTIDNDSKVHRGTTEIQPIDEWFQLDPGTYEVTMENIITVGDSEAGWVITRSTLNRNGVFITSGLYDSKYFGNMCACLHVTTGPIRIKRGTRVGQFLLFKAEMLKHYNGSYGFNIDGTPKPDDIKYNSK